VTIKWYEAIGRVLERVRDPNRRALAATLLEMVAFNPLINAYYLLVTALAAGGVRAVPKALDAAVLRAMCRDYVFFWGPVGLLNYRLVPQLLQVAFTSLCGLLWQIRLASASNGEAPAAEEDGGPPTNDGLSNGCPCCVVLGAGKRLLQGDKRRQQRRLELSLVEPGVWAWTGLGSALASTKPQLSTAGLRDGDALTGAQLMLIREFWPGAEVKDLLKHNLVRPNTLEAKLEFLARWEKQVRHFKAPVSPPLAPPLPSAEDGGVLVPTVLGPVSSRKLGMVLPHEHCLVSSSVLAHYPEMVPYEDFVFPEAIAAFKELKANGGGAIIDCTTLDLGRDVQAMTRISREAGIHIICTTGCWLDPNRSMHSCDPDTMAKMFIRDCTEGIQGTGIKAGIIKCAHESGLTWDRGGGFSKIGEVIARAVARAHKATGCPITTHTEVEEHIGLAQIAIFEEEGVDLNRVYIGHCNDSTDLDYLTTMLKKGVWLGLDRTGPGMAEPGHTRPEWEERARTVWRLIEAGWGHRILLSHDWMVYLGFAGAVDGAKKHRSQNPLGYTFILKKLIPRVLELGATRAQTDAILYDNPRRFLEAGAAAPVEV